MAGDELFQISLTDVFDTKMKGGKEKEGGEAVKKRREDEIQKVKDTTNNQKNEGDELKKEEEKVDVKTARNLFRETWIFHPELQFIGYWNGFLYCLIVYVLISVPLIVAFDSYATSEDGQNTDISCYVIDGIFFIDVLLNFNIAFFWDEKAAFIANRRAIAINYVSSKWFYLDLVSCIPFDAFLSSQSTSAQLFKIGRLVKLLKVARLVSTFSLRKQLEKVLTLSTYWIDSLIMLLKVGIFCHITTCIWWGVTVSISDGQDKLAWLDMSGMVYDPLRFAPFNQQYVGALYFIVTTLTTTGYGDIVPVSNNERVITIVLMVVGATLFGYVKL